MAPTGTAAEAPLAPTAPAVPRRTVRVVIAAIAGAAALAALAGYLLTSRDGAPANVAEDPGLVHVHGLGIDAGDGTVYAATHTGLFRVEDGAAERIGDRYQDTMGFTVAGPGLFLASGHPDLRDERLRVPGKPPLLGLIESTDGGRSWTVRSLLGDADLHTLAVAGRRIVAYDSTGERVLVSDDDGRSWDTRSSVALTDLALDPADDDHVLAVTVDGAVIESTDGARTWAPHPAPPLDGVTVLRWGAAGLWAGTDDGTVARFEDGAWRTIFRLDGAIEALDAADTVLVAAAGSGIFASPDGQQWERLYEAEERS